MGFAGIQRVRAVHGDVEETHAFDIDFEDRDIGPEAGRHARGVHARSAATDDDDFARQHAGHAAEEHTLATIVGLARKWPPTMTDMRLTAISLMGSRRRRLFFVTVS